MMSGLLYIPACLVEEKPHVKYELATISRTIVEQNPMTQMPQVNKDSNNVWLLSVKPAGESYFIQNIWNTVYIFCMSFAKVTDCDPENLCSQF